MNSTPRINVVDSVSLRFDSTTGNLLSGENRLSAFVQSGGDGKIASAGQIAVMDTGPALLGENHLSTFVQSGGDGKIASISATATTPYQRNITGSDTPEYTHGLKVSERMNV